VIEILDDRPWVTMRFGTDRAPADAALLTVIMRAGGHLCFALLETPRRVRLYPLGPVRDSGAARALLLLAVEWFETGGWHDLPHIAVGRALQALGAAEWTDLDPVELAQRAGAQGLGWVGIGGEA
jgi:hypothetical protein